MNTHSRKIKVVCPKDCGNAPKKNLLKDLNIAFAEYRVEDIVEHLKDDVLWNIVGNKFMRSKKEIIEEIERMKEYKVSEIRISNVITHGNTGSVNGILIRDDEKCFAFCNVYHFSGFGRNSKIKKITSYIIETEQSDDME